MLGVFSPLSHPRLWSGVSDSLKHDNSSEGCSKHITKQHADWDPTLCCCWSVHTALGNNVSSLQRLTGHVHPSVWWWESMCECMCGTAEIDTALKGASGLWRNAVIPCLCGHVHDSMYPYETTLTKLVFWPVILIISTSDRTRNSLIQAYVKGFIPNCLCCICVFHNFILVKKNFPDFYLLLYKLAVDFVCC